MKKSELGADEDCDCLLSTKPTTPKLRWEYDDLMIIPSEPDGLEIRSRVKRLVHSADVSSRQSVSKPYYERQEKVTSRLSSASKKKSKLTTPRRLFPSGEAGDRLYYDAKMREARKRQAKEKQSKTGKKFQPLTSSLQHLRRRSERAITEAFETALDEYGCFNQDAYERAFLKLYADITRQRPEEEHYRILWPTIARGKNVGTYEDFSSVMMLVFFDGQVDPEEKLEITDPHIARLIYLISKKVHELQLTRQTSTELSRPCLELLQEETRECTFQPTLISSDPRNPTARNRNTSQPAFVRLFEIAEKKNKKMNRLRQLKNSKDAEKETMDCTFAPRTNKTAFMMRDVFETLYQKVPMHYRHRSGLATRTKMTSEEKEAEVCTFAPDISRTKHSWQDSKESFNRTKPKGFEESVYRQRAGLVRRMQRQRDVLTGGKPNYSERYDRRMRKEKKKREYLKLAQKRLNQEKKQKEEADARKQAIELVEKSCHMETDKKKLLASSSLNSVEYSQDDLGLDRQTSSEKGYYEIELENQEKERNIEPEQFNEFGQTISPSTEPQSSSVPPLQPSKSETPLTVEISTNAGVGRIEIYNKQEISEAVKQFASKHSLSEMKKHRLEELLLSAIRDEDK